MEIKTEIANEGYGQITNTAYKIDFLKINRDKVSPRPLYIPIWWIVNLGNGIIAPLNGLA